MYRRKILIFLGIQCVVFLIITPVVLAETCFFSPKQLTLDAQSIRIYAMDMGWEVGKPTSFAAAAIIEGKVKIYPKDDVEVCLREVAGILQARAQSQSEDAGKAEWHKLRGKRKEDIISRQRF